MRKVLYILGQLSDEDIDWMVRVGRRLDFPAEHDLIHGGVPIADLFILLTGSASVIVERAGTIRRLGPGEVIGEMSLVDDRPPSASIRLGEPSTLLAIDREILRQKLSADTGFAARLYRALAMFLADRLRTNTLLLGYGQLGQEEEDPDELTGAVLDSVHLAGARFQDTIRRLMAKN